MRGRSYSPSPPRRGYGRRRRSPSPRGRYRGYDRDAPTSLLVRNLRLDCRPEDLRRPFSEFGPLKDVYLPRDYYTKEPRGFGFVQFVDPGDAAEAKYQMDRQVFQGRELTVVFAEENRKKPLEMRARERTRSRSYDRRRSSSRRRSSARYSHSRSPSRRHARSRSRSRSGSRDSYSPSPKRRHHSRSVSPTDRKRSRERSYSPEKRERSYSRSPSPRRSRSRSRSRSISKGERRRQSQDVEDHAEELNKESSPSE